MQRYGLFKLLQAIALFFLRQTRFFNKSKGFHQHSRLRLISQYNKLQGKLRTLLQITPMQMKGHHQNLQGVPDFLQGVPNFLNALQILTQSKGRTEQ